jgi:predicted metal-dependent phosphoesterase TrpH
MRVDYHFHTGSSYDSRTTPEAVLERALSAQLDVLCVTDHDTIEGALELGRIRCPAVEVVVGCEFTAEDGSHLIGLGLRDMISERRIPALLEEIRLQGGLVLLPHPFRRGSGIFRNEARRSEAFLREVLSRTHLVECFNGRDSYEKNRQSHLFALAHGLPAVAGSDAHTPDEIGTVYVEYERAGFVHGVSPRRVVFPAQDPVLENGLKRRLMELLHAHEASLPPFVKEAHRALRRRLRRDVPRKTAADARMHYELPGAPGGARAHGE